MKRFQILILLSILTSLFFYAYYRNQAIQYRVVIDAGSSGSRILIFEAKTLLWSFKEKTEGGIHKAFPTREGVSKFLEPLLVFASKNLQTRMSDYHDLPVYFRATAGLRTLEKDKQEKILTAVKDYIHQFGFRKVSAEILDGASEGVYAWIAANYLRGFDFFTGSQKETFGILEMGGGSTQITFVPDETPKENGVHLRFGENSFDLYSYSYEGLGAAEAMQQFAVPACFQKGIEDDQSIFEDLKPFLQKKAKGEFKSCKESVLTKMKGVHQEELRRRFLAFGGFAQLRKVLNVKNFSSSVLDRFGKIVCETDWSSFKKNYEKRDLPKFLATACFESSYYSALLSAYGFPYSTDAISADLTIEGQEVSWALGLVVFEALGGEVR